MNKDRVLHIIKEAFGADAYGIATSAPINKYDDSKLTKEINKFFEKKKEVEVVNIGSNGDVWLIDLRFTLEEPNNHMQIAREQARTKAYELKREWDEFIIKEFNIPSSSISGLRTPSLNVCEFEITFIYANKGNIKSVYE